MNFFPEEALINRSAVDGTGEPWTIELLHALLGEDGPATSIRSVERSVISNDLLPPSLSLPDLEDENGNPVRRYVAEAMMQRARRERIVSLFVQIHRTPLGKVLLAANDERKARRWVFLNAPNPRDEELIDALGVLCGDAQDKTLLWPHGGLCGRLRQLADSNCMIAEQLTTAFPVYAPSYAGASIARSRPVQTDPAAALSHLDRLEAESMYIMREVAATADNPVMLYSVGKDSSVMLHLARKAFHPAPPPFPLLHIDTGWKFREMIQFRDIMAAEAGVKLLTHTNQDGLAKGINPISHASAVYTDIMKTQALKQALDEGHYDVAFGGARRDEEKSRAKERIFSFRTSTHRWDPKYQRPELWNLYNTEISRGESIRVFPISNWTELDVWQYIHREAIRIVPLYFAAKRPFVRRDGMIIMLDDDRLEPLEEEVVEFEKSAFAPLAATR